MNAAYQALEEIVVINPDRFRPRTECKPFSRRYSVRGSMSEECLYGQHSACTKPDCPCICREPKE